MNDRKVEIDEQRRVTQHEAVKGTIERDVNSELTARTHPATVEESRRLDNVAGDMRGRAITDVEATEREVKVGRSTARLAQVVDYLFGVLYVLLAMRLILTLMAANSASGFVKFITGVTEPFYAPFRGIVESPTIEGGHTLMMPLVVAIVVYMLLHLGIKGLMRLVAQRRTTI